MLVDLTLQGLESIPGIAMGSESRLNAPGSFGGTLPLFSFGPCSTVSTGQSCALWNATIPGVLHFTVQKSSISIVFYDLV
jgi:hypothetical protein